MKIKATIPDRRGKDWRIHNGKAEVLGWRIRDGNMAVLGRSLLAGIDGSCVDSNREARSIVRDSNLRGSVRSRNARLKLYLQ